MEGSRYQLQTGEMLPGASRQETNHRRWFVLAAGVANSEVLRAPQVAEGTGGAVGLGACFGGNAAIVRGQSQSPQSSQPKAFLVS